MAGNKYAHAATIATIVAWVTGTSFLIYFITCEYAVVLPHPAARSLADHPHLLAHPPLAARLC